ncbi:MAG: hypothetical protein L0216_05370 [Planctomycetales bacterium]|nr:hypothetical protein [Planctomycetales bacterium]
MPVNFTRTYWKRHLPADVLEKARQAARRLDPSGKLLLENADTVRIIGTREQIAEVETAAGLPDPEYWKEKPPEGSPLKAAAAAAPPAKP